MRRSTSSAITIVVAIIVLAVVAFLIAVSIKSGVDGTSFADTINNIFGITTSAPADPVTPPAETPETTSAIGLL